MTDILTALREKIAKLLNMTEANGCTEDEAETALRMASGMAARAGIELDALRPKDYVAPKAKAKRVSQEFKLHQTLCAAAAAVLYGVECQYYNYGKEGLHFVGREENIELTEATMFWLMRQVEQLYKQALPKGLSQSVRAEFRRSFKEACAYRVNERAKELVERMQRENAAAQSATGSNALVVLGHFQTLKTENEQYWTDLFKAQDEKSRKWIEKAAQEKAERLAAMTPEQRATHEAATKAYEARMEKEREKAAKKAARRPYRPRKTRSIRWGVGTNAGRAAAESVRLRTEVK